MVENLKGSTILIGRESDNGRLLVSLMINGTAKTAAMGSAGSVPNCVSRCKPAEGVAHCKIVIDGGGNMTIVNMKPANVTYVNGVEIVSKRISESSNVELGKDRYRLNVDSMLAVASKVVNVVKPPTPKTYSVRPLEQAWNEYHDGLLAIKRRGRSIMQLRSASPIFTLGSGSIAAIAKTQDWSSGIFIVTTTLTVIGLILMIYSFYKSYTDKSIEESERLTEDFQRRYVCPNPNCHHFLGMQSYNVLRQNKKCPYCGCQLTDK